MNPWEQAARERKANRLLAAIDLLDAPPSADDVAAWPVKTWSLLAMAASEIADVTVNPPSDETKKFIVERLRAQEAARARAVAAYTSKVVDIKRRVVA